MKNATIQSIMSDKVVSVSTDATVDHIQEVFQTHSYRHIPVTKDGKLVGIINRIDFISRIQNWSSLFVSTPSSEELTAKDLIITNCLKLSVDTTIRQAIHDMKEDKRGVICVINAQQEVVGIVTLFDLINKYIHKSMYNANANRKRLMGE